MIIPFLFLANFTCPTGNSTSNSAFKQIEGKCYFIEIFGCPDRDGCTYEEVENICKTVFGPGIPGKIFEPTTLNINNAVLTAAKEALGSWYFWIGVSVEDLTYKSNGKPVSINPIPWESGQRSKSSNSLCMVAASDTMKWHSNFYCNVYQVSTICETNL